MIVRNDFISIVVPAFNEEGNVAVLASEISKYLQDITDYELLFVDDGSTDNTLDRLRLLAKNDKRIKYVSLSRNFGHQNALKAGLVKATGKSVITMDCDLQHPPSLLPKMLFFWKDGYDVVYTVKRDYQPTIFRKFSTGLFYLIVNKLSDVRVDYGAADFRLMDRKVVDVIINLEESITFLRGFVSWCGFKQKALEYSPAKRFSGKSNYSFHKLLALAINGIISFSIRPLQLSTIFGFMLSIFSGFYAVYAIIMHFSNMRILTGWTSLIISVLFLGGIQLLMLGIIGEYLGRLYLETKKRPSYIVKTSNV